MKALTLLISLLFVVSCNDDGTRVVTTGTKECPNKQITAANIDLNYDISGELQATVKSAKTSGAVAASAKIEEKIKPFVDGIEKVNLIHTYVYAACMACKTIDDSDKEFCKDVFKVTIAKITSLESDELKSFEEYSEEIDKLVDSED